MEEISSNVFITIIAILAVFIIGLLAYIALNALNQRRAEKEAKKLSEARKTFANNTLNTVNSVNGVKAENDSDNVFVSSEHKTVFVDLPHYDTSGTMFLFQGPSRIKLVDKDRPDKVFDCSLSEPVEVGFDTSCKVCVNYDETVSNKHCRIYVSGGKTYVENLSQTNVVIVNGQKIDEPIAIFSGTEIILGRVRLLASF